VTTAVGKVLVAPIAPGEPLTATRLADSALGDLVPPGRLVIELAAATAPAGLAAGDRVDVLATFPGARPYTSLVGTDVRVVRVRDGAAGIDGTAAVLIALDVDALTARAVLGAAASATLGIAVHGPAATPSSPGGTGSDAS
jgi:hypothetical protein